MKKVLLGLMLFVLAGCGNRVEASDNTCPYSTAMIKLPNDEFIVVNTSVCDYNDGVIRIIDDIGTEYATSVVNVVLIKE